MRKTVLPVTSDMAQRPDIVAMGWVDKDEPALAEAFSSVQRLADEGDQSAALAFGIISEALQAGKRAEAALESARTVNEGLAEQARSIRTQWLEDLKDAAVGLEKAVKEGYALCEARAHRHETAAKHGFAHEARELSRDVTKRLPLTGAPFAIDGAAADAKLIATGYAQALKNVHEYKWPHRGGPTEDDFSDFYAAIEARATPARCEDTSTDPCDNLIRCRRPAGHRADDGGPGWHSNGPIFWNADTALTWGDETSEGPFTPAMPDDELPEESAKG